VTVLKKEKVKKRGLGIFFATANIG